MNIRTLLAAGLISLFLSSCATTSGRDAPPPTDLQLVRIGVKHLTEKRRVEGTIQHRDEAETNGQLWNYTGRLEDKSALDDGDKDRIRAFLDESLDAIEKSRLPACPWWNWACQARNRKTLQD